MVIDLRRIFDVPGSEYLLDCKIPLEELSEINGYEFTAPVALKGNIVNRAGMVIMRFSTEFTLKVVCDRCLKELERDYKYDFEHVIVTKLNTDSDEYIVADGERIDINNIAVSDMLLQLPSKMLCIDDCKGLCPVCGCDLNESDCGCADSDF